MSTTGWIVVGFVVALFAILASRKGEIRLRNENNLKIMEIELALKKEENKRLEIMKDAILKSRGIGNE